MGWVTPSTFTGETVDENDLNQVSSNETYLYAGVKYSSYVGTGVANVARAHGMGRQPQLVFITVSGANAFVIHTGAAEIYGYTAAAVINIGVAHHLVSYPTAINFYVGNATSYTQSANLSGQTYQWVAFG